MNRRGFIKKSGLLVLGGMAAVGIESAAAAETSETSETSEKWGLIIDLNRCTGCQSCVIACKNQSKTISGNFNTRILSAETGSGSAARIVYTPVQCNQCDNPPCVAACPAHATFKLANGIVVTDWDKCESNGACVESCPYGARFLDSQHGNKADKCDFCLDRLALGLKPACVESCPSKARIFGNMKRPRGEFAAYLNKAGLRVRKPEFNTGPQVHYIPSQHNKEGMI